MMKPELTESFDDKREALRLRAESEAARIVGAMDPKLQRRVFRIVIEAARKLAELRRRQAEDFLAARAE